MKYLISSKRSRAFLVLE